MKTVLVPTTFFCCDYVVNCQLVAYQSQTYTLMMIKILVESTMLDNKVNFEDAKTMFLT